MFTIQRPLLKQLLKENWTQLERGMPKQSSKQIGQHIGKLRQTLAVKDFLVGEVT